MLRGGRLLIGDRLFGELFPDRDPPPRALAAAAAALTAAAAAAVAISAEVAEPRLRAGKFSCWKTGELPPCSFSCRLRFLRIVEFQRFLIALSVRPGSILTILDHLVPICCTSSMISWSSSSVHSSLLTEGHKWLCHLRADARRNRS